MNSNINYLTQREKEALRLFGRGHDAKSAAGVLAVSVNSVNERLREARRKLEVSTSREAARIFLEAEASSPQEAWDKKMGLDDSPNSVAICADPHRRRVRKVSPRAKIGVGIMLLMATAALLALSLADVQVPQIDSQRSPAATTAGQASPTSSSNSDSEYDYSIDLEVRSSAQSSVWNNMPTQSGAIASVSRSGEYDIHFNVAPDPNHTGVALVSVSIVIPRAGSTMRYKRSLSVAEGQSAEFVLEPIGTSKSPINAVVITPRRSIS